MQKKIIQRTLRVSATAGTPGNGATVARQLDAALMKVGFKLSGELLGHLSGLHPVVVTETSQHVLDAVRELVGDHVAHNVYFIDFPENVPDTLEFWIDCIIDALFDPDSAAKVTLQLAFGRINLLDLPRYGNYQHSFEEMVAAHEQFIPSAKDRVTILHLGGTLAEEALALYLQLAGSAVPLNEADRELLAELAAVCLTDPQPEVIPVRENKALINQVRLENGMPLLVDTVTDVLRLACALSGGDVTLETPAKFVSLSRKTRRALLAALHEVVNTSEAKLADVNRYPEQWKRLGERLHPHEYAANYPLAQGVFAVARGDRRVRTLAGKVEIALAQGDLAQAVKLLSVSPGMLMRSLDRLLRLAEKDQVETVLGAVEAVVGKVSGRVILSVREYLENRLSKGTYRVFVNRTGRAWVTEDTRDSLSETVVSRVAQVLDAEITQRLPQVEHLVFDPQVLGLALPMSQKTQASGFGILPRGSVMPVEEGILRFFMHWKQHDRRTDYDLSVLMLDDDFQALGYVSYTNLKEGGYAVHSGDLTSAPDGASEFIDIDLAQVDLRCRYLVPQVNIYSGEGFDEVEESFFGFMSRTREQMGQPFEARTVRSKSDLRGSSRVALPIAFVREDEGAWYAKWLHLYLNGTPNFNRVEENRVSTALLSRLIVERNYLTVGYLLNLLGRKATQVSEYAEGMELFAPVAYVGLETPEDLPKESEVYTSTNLADLIPT